MKFETHQKQLSTVGGIALTDIIFLLLIFFLLSASFVMQPGIKVNLPEAATEADNIDQPITITLTQDRTIYVNDKPVVKSELVNYLEWLISAKPDQVVIVKADAEVSLQSAVELIDAAKTAGAEKVMIATQDK